MRVLVNLKKIPINSHLSQKEHRKVRNINLSIRKILQEMVQMSLIKWYQKQDSKEDKLSEFWKMMTQMITASEDLKIYSISFSMVKHI